MTCSDCTATPSDAVFSQTYFPYIQDPEWEVYTDPSDVKAVGGAQTTNAVLRYRRVVPPSCPQCGHCPTCGRRIPARPPVYPDYTWFPWQISPHWGDVFCGPTHTCTTATLNVTATITASC